MKPLGQIPPLASRPETASRDPASRRGAERDEGGGVASGGRGDQDPWMGAMRRGDLAGAWDTSDAVLRERAGKPCHHWPRHEQYVWDGRPLDGKRVLVRCYHGLGDTVQFIRYARMLRRVAREVIVWAQPSLLALLRHAEGIDQLLPLHDGTPECAYDADVEIMELAHVFRSTLDTLPATVPYVHVPGTAAPGARHLRRVRDVGIVWQSGGWDGRRSIATPLLAPLMQVPGVRWHALQQGRALDEWRPAWGSRAATDDVLELARRMCALDLVITVDSFPAHLAGALGVPTWTLLHADPDWRWMLGRPDSPWYPTMRLFRQPAAGDWAGVIARVVEALTGAT